MLKVSSIHLFSEINGYTQIIITVKPTENDYKHKIEWF